MKETLYYNGNILTMDEHYNNPEAVLVRDGKIAAVGAYEEFKGTENQIDLKGATMAPGFIDGHSHISMAGNFPSFYPPPAGVIDTLETLIREVKKAIKEADVQPGRWFMGMGYDNAVFPDKKHPTCKQLDEISTEVAIVMTHISGHVAVLNSKALELAGVTKDSVSPEGGVIVKDPVTGEPTGLLEENAMNAVMVAAKEIMPTPQKAVEGLMKAQDLYASFGLTTVQDGLSSPGIPDLLRGLAQAGKLKLDIIGYPPADPLSKDLENVDSFDTSYNNHFRIGGAKFFLDGSPQAKTAWLSQPFYVVPDGYDKDYCGYPRYKDEKVFEVMKTCLQNGWQVLVHCNGDAACEQFIVQYERALKETGVKKDLRPVMIHAQTVRDDQLDRMKKIGMVPSFFHDHTYYWGDYHLASVLGPERGRRISPLKAALDRGITFTTHQDTPVVTPNIIFAIHNSVNRITRDGQEIGPEFCIEPMDAMRAVTIWGAIQYHEEDSKGSITPGKLADFVILDKNPLTVPKKEIKDIKVKMTIKEDTVIYKAE
ncbi:MAG: amidohydrolase [Lachnospiraceae bacterium]